MFCLGRYGLASFFMLFLFSVAFNLSAQPAPMADEPLAGLASWYGEDFHGRPTANGETYDMMDLTAAHKTLPFNTRVRVTNLLNNRTIIVRINDRGPFKGDRLIDVSKGAAERLDMIKDGVVPVKLEILGVLDSSPSSNVASSTVPLSETTSPAELALDEALARNYSEWNQNTPLEDDWTSPSTPETQQSPRAGSVSRAPAPGASSEFIYFIQVGSYSTQTRAVNVANDLKRIGFPAEVRYSGSHYRVYFRQAEVGLDATLASLINRGYIDPLVRRSPVEGSVIPIP